MLDLGDGLMALREYTKVVFANTLMDMMKEMPLEKLRVGDLCARCGAQRQSFYYHFRDKYELMAWIFFEAARDTDILDVESAAKSMNEMRKNYVYFKRAYEDKSQNPMWAYILEYFVEK